MKLPEHVTLSFLLAQLDAAPRFGPGGTALMIAAGLLPDLDGVTLVAGWRVYRRYHRVVGHGLPVTLFGPALLAGAAAWMGVGPFVPLWAWAQTSLLAHLATDGVFYRWPVQLLWPVSSRGPGLGLVTWNDLVPTIVLYAASVVALAWPEASLAAATVGLGTFCVYLAWRAWRPRSRFGWSAWITGDWARTTPRPWRWLTGDFVT
jgi:inner membrane protein